MKINNFMIKAFFETPNFTFEAYGNNRDEALNSLKNGWKNHSKWTGAETDYLDRYINDIVWTIIETGKCYRDHEEV
jgi:hypothetical protein